jgi:DNA-binding CsgD family transcriptional regulator
MLTISEFSPSVESGNALGQRFDLPVMNPLSVTTSERSQSLPARVVREMEILDSMHLGVMVVSSQLELLYCNLKAKNICRSYLQEADALPIKLMDACKRFMVEADEESSEPLILECYPVPGRKLLIQISWMQEPLRRSRSHQLPANQRCMLIVIKDCYEAIMANMKREQKRYGLTEREAQVWMMLDLAFSYQEVADQLGISLNTVKTHVKNINLKRRNHPQDSRLWFCVEPDWLDGEA